MTSSYGYQRPLSSEEELYLQNQALRAELQRRDQEKEGGFIDTLGKTALAAGAVAGAALAGRRLAGGRNTSATFDLSKVGEKVADVRRAAAARIAPQEVVPASRPAPATSAERLQQIEEVTRQARAERPQGVRQVNLTERIQPVTVQDLGPTDYPVSPEEQKHLLNYIENVMLPMEQKRLVGSQEISRTPLTGQKTNLPTTRTPGTFREFSREASGVAAAERLAQDPELLSLVKTQAAEELSEARSFQSKAQAEYRNLLSERADEAIGALRKEANTVQAAAESDFGPQQFLRDAGYVEAESLVDQQRLGAIGRIDQFANAANPAEDQATGRVKMALQRNEDTNLAAIEMAEDAVDAQIAKAAQNDPAVASVSELDSAINQAASTLPDGLPVDQAERLPKDPWAGAATVPVPQRQTAPSTETKLLPSAAVSPREKSQQFLQRRFEELGATIPSPTRRERILSADPALAEAYELYASTGDPSVLSRLSETPSSPVNVTLREQSEFVSPEVSTKTLYKPGVYPEYVGDLIEKDIELTNQISSLSQEKLNIAARQKELGEQELMLKNAMAQEPAERDSYSRMLGKVKYEQQNLPSPESLNADIGDAMAERDFTRVQLESAESLGPRYKLTPREEGIRPFYQQTAEGKIIPETLELRSGRRSMPEGAVEKAASGGGIRGRVAEYDPDTQVGSSIGTYGIEPRNIPIADPELRPTALQREETKVKLKQVPTGQEALSEYIEARRRVKSATTEQKKQSLIESERIRRDIINRGGF